MPVAGQTIDAHFVSLTKAIELEGNQRGKYYVLGREPQHTTAQKNHQLWEHIRESEFPIFQLQYISGDFTPFPIKIYSQYAW